MQNGMILKKDIFGVSEIGMKIAISQHRALGAVQVDGKLKSTNHSTKLAS